jgi:nitrate/nitrite transporter NarK
MLKSSDFHIVLASCLLPQSAYAAANYNNAPPGRGETPMDIERSAMRKVYWRLLPLTILVYFLCYLDRTRLGLGLGSPRRAALDAVIGVPIARNLGTVWALVGISIAAMGFYGSKGPFWAIPSMILTGTAAASGIAWINSVGNLGGFFGPTMVGWAKDYTGSFAGGLYALAGFALLSAVVSALGLRIPNPVRQELASVPAE